VRYRTIFSFGSGLGLRVGWLQDRLVKELSLRSISTPEAGKS
jgi:hypothetical protein